MWQRIIERFIHFDKFSTGPADHTADFARSSPENSVSINGHSIQDLRMEDLREEQRQLGNPEPTVPPDPLFPDDDTFKAFLKKHLLNQLPKEEQDKQLAIAFKYLHQGALMGLTRLPMYEALSPHGYIVAPPKTENGVLGQRLATNFTTTTTGFTLEQTITAGRLNRLGEDEFITSDPEQEFIFKASCAVDVNLSGEEPTFTLIKDEFDCQNKLLSLMLTYSLYESELQKIISDATDPAEKKRLETLLENIRQQKKETLQLPPSEELFKALERIEYELVFHVLKIRVEQEANPTLKTLGGELVALAEKIKTDTESTIARGKKPQTSIHQLIEQLKLDAEIFEQGIDAAQRLKAITASFAHAETMSKGTANPARKWPKILAMAFGVALILASIGAAAATYGFATPIAVAGFALGWKILAGAAAFGLVTAAAPSVSLFQDRKSIETKYKESLEKIKGNADNEGSLDLGTPTRTPPPSPTRDRPAGHGTSGGSASPVGRRDEEHDEAAASDKPTTDGPA